MAYTLRGRVESRLAAAALPAVAAAVVAVAVAAWWPLELAGLMVAVGLALDVLVYHRALPYQPGWAALPLGVLELALIMALAPVFGIDAPLPAALALFAGAWLVAQVLGHAVYPLLHLSYGDDGGELGRGGYAVWLATPLAAAVVLGTAWVTQPPTLRLEAGVHRGPIVLDRSVRLVGEPGAVVEGGIVVTADDVVVRNVTVRGGENGITVEWARNVLLDGVVVEGAELDGIHARRSSVTIRGCRIGSLTSPYAQAIDISFSFDLAASRVEGCTILGGQEGIVINSARADVRRNHVMRTTLRAITINEMGMATVERNFVEEAIGVGILCIDYSVCEIRRNVVRGTRPDLNSDNPARRGYAIQSHFHAVAEVRDNRLELNARRLGAFAGGRFEPD